MKKSLLALIILFAVFPSCSRMSPTDENENTSAVKEEIWAMEEAYVANVRDAKHDELQPIWHDRFLGWPDPMPLPSNKEDTARYLKERNPRPGAWNFKIERAGIRVLGNVAINHYIIHSSWMFGGAEQKRATRITHTWIREDSQWRILGGMSNRQ